MTFGQFQSKRIKGKATTLQANPGILGNWYQHQHELLAEEQLGHIEDEGIGK